MARHYASNRNPTSPRELAQAMADPARAAEFFGGSEAGMRDFRDQFIASMEASGDLDSRIAAAAQVEAAKLMRSTPVDGRQLAIGGDGAQAGGVSAKSRRHGLYNRQADGTAVDHLVKDENALAKCFLAAFGRGGGGMDAEESQRYRYAMQNAMSERVPGQGGFLVPERLRSDILMAVLEQSIIRPRARLVPMDSLRVPYPTIDETTHTSSVMGGVTGFWTEEGATITPSQPSFARTVLEAKKLAVYTEIPNELFHDSAGLMTFLEETLPAAVAFYEDLGFISGTGVGQPQGYTLAPGAIKVTRKTASRVKFEDIAAMYPRMLPVGMHDAVWVCSPNVIGQLLSMVMPTSDATTTYVAPPLWLTNGSVAQGAEYTLLGHPLFVTEKAPAMGTLGDLAFVNFSYYLLGDRQAMSLSTSEHYKFAQDLFAVRLTERVDGRLWIQSPITPANGDVTLSPAVLLN